MSGEPIKVPDDGILTINMNPPAETTAGLAAAGRDPSEASRREKLGEVNAPAAKALRAATEAAMVSAVSDPETVGAAGGDAEASARKFREDEAMRLLRIDLVAKHGADDVYDTDQLTRTFEVTGFLAPYCLVRRRSDGKKGSVTFTHHPRLYYGFKAN